MSLNPRLFLCVIAALLYPRDQLISIVIVTLLHQTDQVQNNYFKITKWIQFLIIPLQPKGFYYNLKKWPAEDKLAFVHWISYKLLIKCHMTIIY